MTETQEMVLIKGLVCGALTGSLEICFTYPIKYVKTQLQLEEKLGAQKKYSGMFDCAKQTLRNHGFFGMYRGLNILMYGPKSAVRFSAFETIKSNYVDDKGVLSPTNRFICGLCAGAIEATIVNTPLETIEVKLINDLRNGKPRFNGFIHGARLIYKEQGIRGVYSGWAPSVLKQASNQGIRFFVVESLMNLYQKGDPKKPIPKLIIGMFGGIAGVCSVVGNNPMDVVKTRMQGLGSSKYKNMLDCFIQIWRQEGFWSFYRGMTPRLSRVFLEVALTFMIYDTIISAWKF